MKRVAVPELGTEQRPPTAPGTDGHGGVSARTALREPELLHPRGTRRRRCGVCGRRTRRCWAERRRRRGRSVSGRSGGARDAAPDAWSVSEPPGGGGAKAVRPLTRALRLQGAWGGRQPVLRSRMRPMRQFRSERGVPDPASGAKNASIDRSASPRCRSGGPGGASPRSEAEAGSSPRREAA
jgi:hypothetical protein